MAPPQASQPPSDRPFERWTGQYKAAVIIEVIKGQLRYSRSYTNQQLVVSVEDGGTTTHLGDAFS